jgi:hypothetical protein
MRSILIAVLVACGGCCLEEQTELVAVRVPVWRENATTLEVRQQQQVASSVDPCDQPAPDIASCAPVAYVRAGSVMTQPRCYLDTKVNSGDIGRVMQCPSEQVIVAFEHATFVGQSSNGYLNVCKTTTYDFPEGDNCTWRTEQRIVGQLQSRELTFSYTEGPVAGRACTLACRAQATVGVISGG